MVIIKSYKGGIALHMDSDASFDIILEEVAERFEESRKFFRDASMALSVEGRILSPAEEKALIQTIDAHSDVKIMCIVGKNEDTGKNFVKALKRVELQKEENNCRFFRGDVTDGDVVESEGSLVILGNVMPGGLAAATKDIIVLGSLEGDAYAGLDNEDGHFITAVRMNPTRCRIGELTYNAGGSKGLFDKRKNVPCIIKAKNGELINDVLEPEVLEDVKTIQA